MKDFVYIAPSFAREECINSIMSIRYSAGGLSFSIRKENEMLFLYSCTRSFSSYAERYGAFLEVLKRYNIDAVKFAKVEVYETSGSRLLMPTDEFNSDKCDIWLKTMADELPAGCSCNNSSIVSCNATLITYIDNEIAGQFSGHTDNVEVYSIAYPFIKNSIASVPVKSKGYWLFVEYSKRTADVLLMKGGEVLFYNEYQVAQSEDLLFYVLKILEMHGVNGDVNAVFSGETMNADDMVFATLKRYIPSFTLAANVLLKSICNNDNVEVMPLFVHLIN